MVVVFVTCGSMEEAERIAAALVDERLAACVSVVPRVVSVYRWQRERRRDEEALLIIKTQAGRFGELERRVRELHSCSVPEIVALPVEAVSEPYGRWVGESVG